MGTIAETIFTLALRQTLSLRRVIVLLLIAAIPAVIAIIGLITNAEWDSEDRYYFIQGFVAYTTLPLVALIVAAPLFADEIEDRTLTNLILSPVPRWQIALPKLLAITGIVAIPMIVSVFPSTIIIFDEEAYAAATVATLGILIGSIAFISLFAFIGTLTTRAVVFGIIYVFGFEALVSSVIPGLKYVSISGMMLSVMHKLHPPLVDAPLSGSSQLPPVEFAIPAIIAIIVFCNLATVWRLKRMDVH